MFTFLKSHCSLFSTSSLPSLCTVSSISATAESTSGTDFLDLVVGQSATVHNFQEHPRNDALTAAILFLETRDSTTTSRMSKNGEPQRCV
jgi:hypothetical protein